ncbi:MAG: hypothetical protein WC560_12960, partial [Syntrophales bacterium]
LAIGAVNTPVLKLNFSAGSAAVTVTGVKVTRSGLSQDADINNMYLYDGVTRLATNLGISLGKINFNNANGLFTVPAGTTKTITVTLDATTATSSASHVMSFGVASGDVTLSGTGTVSGNFPVSGSQYALVSVSNLATLTLSSAASSTVSVNAGQTNYLVGQVTAQAGNQPVKINSVRLLNVGSVTPSFLQNIKLMNGGTQVGATIAQLGSDNVLTFDMSSAPLSLSSGQTVVLQIYADITGGVNRTFQFSIQQAADVNATDATYSVGIGATLATALGSFPVYFYNATIANGGLVMSRNAASPATNVVAGNTNQPLAKLDLLASGDSIKIQQLNFTITGTAADLTNVRIVDDEGVQLGTTLTTGASPFYAGSGSLNYIISANKTRTLTVYADISSAAAGSYLITLTGGTAQSYTSYASVTVSSVSGYSLAVLTSGTQLAASLNYSLGTPIVTAGASQARIASFNMTAGQINSVNLTGITATIVNSSTIAGWITALTVKVNGVQAGNAQPTVTANQPYTFNAASNVAISPGATAVVDVYANISNSATANSSSMVTLTSVNATNNVGNSVSITGVTGQTVTVTTGGTLTGTVDAATANAAFVGMGVNSVPMGKFRFATNNNGSVILTNVQVYDITTSAGVTTSSDRSFANYKLMDGLIQLATGAEGADSVIAFPLAGLTIPASSYKTLSVVVDTSAYPSASSGAVHAYRLYNYTYNNAAGATTTSIAVSTSTLTYNTNNQTVYRTTLGVAQGSAFTAPTSISGGTGQTVAKFSFAAGSGYDAIVKTITLSQAGTLIQASTTIVLGLYDELAPATLLATSSVASTTAATFNVSSSTSGWTVPIGTSRTLLVKIYSAPANIASVTAGTGSYQVLLQSVSSWSDSVVTSITSVSPEIALPIAGQSITGISS